MENAPVALLIGVPQVLLGSMVAMLIYQRRVDARWVFATGLCLIALACFYSARLDSGWIWREFVVLQLLQALGQPMTVVSLLFLTTSVVHPSEGPYVSGCVNTFRAFGSLLGGAVVGRLQEVRQHFHSQILTDALGTSAVSLPRAYSPADLSALVEPQVVTLATADIYRLLGSLLSSCLLCCSLSTFQRRTPVPQARKN
jgi:DHA2 family multidrug resistance protein